MSEIIPVFEDFGQFQSSTVRGAQAARVMMMLGDFAFSIDTTAYNQLTREASWPASPGEPSGLKGNRMLSFARGWMLLTISSTWQTRISLSSWSAVKEMSWAGGW